MNYAEFLKTKCHLAGDFGFEPTFMPSQLFDFQAALVNYAVRKGDPGRNEITAETR